MKYKYNLFLVKLLNENQKRFIDIENTNPATADLPKVLKNKSLAIKKPSKFIKEGFYKKLKFAN
jgi:hypothetical protein